MSSSCRCPAAASNRRGLRDRSKIWGLAEAAQCAQCVLRARRTGAGARRTPPSSREWCSGSTAPQRGNHRSGLTARPAQPARAGAHQAPPPPHAPARPRRVSSRGSVCSPWSGRATCDAFVNLLGEVVLLLPRFVAGRAKMRGAEMLEVLAESSSRALLIVAVVNLLMGAILAFVGAVQLKTFGAGIYVANLVGDRFGARVDADPDCDRARRPHRRELRGAHRDHAGQRGDRRAHHARRVAGRVPGAAARRRAQPADAAALRLRLRASRCSAACRSRCRSWTCRRPRT